MGCWASLSLLLDDTPVRHVDLLVGFVPLDATLRADELEDLLRLIRVHAAEHREDAIALLEVDVRGDERHFVGPGARRAVLHSEAVEPPLATRLEPLDRAAAAVRADDAWVEVHPAARRAAGQHELVLLRAVPVGLRSEW